MTVFGEIMCIVDSESRPIIYYKVNGVRFRDVKSYELARLLFKRLDNRPIK